MNYFPLAWPFIVAFAFLLFVLIGLLELGILGYAYERMGIPHRYILLVLFLSLIGSAVNIPVAQLPPEQMVSDRFVDFFGVRYVVPVAQQWPGTVVAINVGGALIPVIISFYLMAKNRLYVRSALAVATVAIGVHQVARPISGVGVGVPLFIPTVFAVLAAIVFSSQNTAPVAYVSGSLGTLIGADLLNLGRVHGLGAPVASIGGAGTFDAVFLTGIIAVLLSPMARPRASSGSSVSG
jgi:uncharacterized membrane protein